MPFELTLDILLLVVLLPTLVYVVLLHRRLSSLRADREAVDAVVERMTEATRRADASLKGLRQAAEQAKQLVEEPMGRAQSLRDELAFLVQRADAAGERLAGGLSSAGAGRAVEEGAASRPRSPARGVRGGGDRPAGDRGGDRGGDRPAAAERPAAEPEDVRSQAERDLMNALRNVR